MSATQTLVVVPQLAGSADLMRAFTREIERTMRVIVIEPPGFGSSSSPSGLPSTRALAAAAHAQWSERGIGRAHLFGVSLGGMIAQWMAIDAPERIDRLVLASTASRGAHVIARGKLRSLAVARCLLEPRSERARCLVDTVLTQGALDDERAAEVHDAAREHARSKADLAWLAAAAARHDTEGELDRIASPTLIVSGADDRMIPPAVQASLAARIRGASQVIVPACAHDVTLEQPERTATLVRSFLSGADASLAPRTRD